MARTAPANSGRDRVVLPQRGVERLRGDRVPRVDPRSPCLNEERIECRDGLGRLAVLLSFVFERIREGGSRHHV